MQTLEQNTVESQAVHLPDNSGDLQPGRKIGVEICPSAELTSRFFRGPRPGRSFPILNDDDVWFQRVAVAVR